MICADCLIGLMNSLDISVWLALAALFGAIIGSFLTLITYRLPKDMPVVKVRSQCPSCSATLKIRDLVPIISWLMSKGKCRHCTARISTRYPLTELTCALGAMLAIQLYGPTLAGFAVIGLFWCIVAILLTDFEHYIILDEVQIAAGLFGIAYAYATGAEWCDVAIAAAAGVAIGLTLKYGFLLLRHKDGLGMGDVKFLGVAGIWLIDAVNFVPFLFFSGALGVISGVLWRISGQGEKFPFGPALAIALLLCVVLPQAPAAFWNLYSGLR